MSEYSTENLWKLYDGLTDLAEEESFELEVERLMQLEGWDRDEAELVARARLECEADA
jgi:hypothetical protein